MFPTIPIPATTLCMNTKVEWGFSLWMPQSVNTTPTEKTSISFSTSWAIAGPPNSPTHQQMWWLCNTPLGVNGDWGWFTDMMFLMAEGYGIWEGSQDTIHGMSPQEDAAFLIATSAPYWEICNPSLTSHTRAAIYMPGKQTTCCTLPMLCTFTQPRTELPWSPCLGQWFWP